MEKYDHQRIEKKWRQKWEKSKLYKTTEHSSKEKCYVLDMLPYTSGDGLHVGHPKGYIATDIYSRFKKMSGFNVLHPMGWDAFGLPAENYAIKNKVHPEVAVKKNIKRFKDQLSILGFNYDWDREINTSDPAYYKWTQWIFLKLFEKGLAYESYEPINWCPFDKTGLANEDVEDGKCERCGTPVEKKPMRQWVLRITDYAEKLLDGLAELDWPESIKESQRNWIGKSEGMLFSAPVKDTDITIQTFSAHFEAFRADTFVVIAPDHSLLPALVKGVKDEEKILEYAKNLAKQRLSDGFAQKEAQGMFTGRYIVDPVGNGELPIWIASYALADYGTGIVKCSAHDERDFAFAKKYGIKLKPVLFPENPEARKKVENLELCYTDMKNGTLTEPAEIAGKVSPNTRHAVIAYLEKNALAEKKISYRLRDWVFSRQRYWGEPIPVIHCQHCKNKKQKVLLIHGFEGSGESNWFPWMKSKLEAEGFEVFAPTVKNAAHPKIDEWMKDLLPAIKDFGENDIVIGHSLGCKAVLKLLEKSKKKIKNIFLIAGTIKNSPDWKWLQKEWADSHIPSLKAFWESPVDYEKVSSLAKEINLIISKDDPYVPLEDASALPESWKYDVWSGFGHFDRKQVPELLALFLKAKNTGVVPVSEKDLPVELPEVEFYEPTGTGESPLANIEKWVNVKCPQCGGKAKRETNTMPQWAGSSWYYLRYEDPKNKKAFVDAKKEKYWSPVDFYVGGAEHATRHLIYARFWHKFLFDLGIVSYPEPFKKLQNVGLIGGADGKKMSKRFGNVVNPDEMVELYGADTFRLYEMFMGPFADSIPWSTEGMIGPRRFLEKVWRLQERVDKEAVASKEITTLLNKTIKKVGEDINDFKFNTAVSTLMVFVNALEKEESVSKDTYEKFLILLSPFAPHITEEISENLGNKGSVYDIPWPAFDPNNLQDDTKKIIIQIDGKMRGSFDAEASLGEEEIQKLALSQKETIRWITGKTIKKVIVVKDRIVSIVTE